MLSQCVRGYDHPEAGAVLRPGPWLPHHLVPLRPGRPPAAAGPPVFYIVISHQIFINPSSAQNLIINEAINFANSFNFWIGELCSAIPGITTVTD